VKRLLVVALLSSSACFVEPANPPPATGPGPAGGFGAVDQSGQPAGSGMAAGGAIEVGCSYNGTQIRGEVGTTVLVNCPAGCGNTAGLWGTDVYTADSGICRAAIHAGVIGEGGGNVFVTLEPGRPAYRGTVRNGQRSGDYGQYPKSYHLQRP